MHPRERENEFIILTYGTCSIINNFILFYCKSPNTLSKNNHYDKIFIMMKKILHSNNLKTFLFASLFVFLLIVLRAGWTNFLHIPDQVTAEQGTIDLREIDTSDNFKMKLNGEWAFYPNALVSPENLDQYATQNEKIYSNFPEAWNPYFENEEKIHYGTYHLRILKEHDVPQLYGINIPEGLSTYEVYVDGRLIGGLGSLSTDDEDSAATGRPNTYYFMLDSSESEIIIQGMQANRYLRGGIYKAIVLGDLHSMEQAKLSSNITQIGVCIVLALYFLYTILLFTIGVRDKSLIYFSLLSVTTAVTILASDNKILLIHAQYNWVWAEKFVFFTYTLALLLFVLFIQTIIKEYSKFKILNVLSLFYIAYLVFLLLAPIDYIYHTIIFFKVLYIVFPLIVATFMLILILKGQKGIMFLLLTAIAVSSNSISVTINQNDGLPANFYPFDLLIAITCLSAFWFTRYFQSTLQTEQLSKKLQKSIDQKDDFLANTSHELRNPLHGIMNIAQTLLEKDSDQLDNENKSNLQLLITIGNHMSFMLDDLLDIIQLKEKTLHLQKRRIHIHSVVTGVSEMFRFMIRGKPVELLIVLPLDLPPVMADENRLIQIFSNLIHNAIKFTDKGTVTIDAIVRGEKLFISVEDTGIGIDDSMLDKIFDPYEQADSSMTSMGSGLGLGLSICQEFITLHGGTISVSSVVGQGTTFTFSLPIAHDTTIETKDDSSTIFEHVNLSPQYAKLVNDYSKTGNDYTVTPHKDATIVTSNTRILIVDDDTVNLQLLSNLLSTENYKIETALNGLEALIKLDEGNFDLVISDIMMPHMSGYELAERIRERFSISELPILFLTARHQREDIQKGFLVGANDHVTKPMEYIVLKARVNALIRVKQSSEERLRMEAAWLQAQIQPHFFFNTLNSIISLNGVDEEKMEELLLAFSDYLQTSFSFQNADLVVPIDYELKLVRSYIAIEQIRFNNRISVIWDIPENIQLSVPPLAIQTLVENAIQHGILKRVEGGTIKIQITESEEAFTISIIDNGVGFDSSAPKNKKSIGFLNTSQRLNQLFNVELNVDSAPNTGTTISFPIPKEHYKKEF